MIALVLYAVLIEILPPAAAEIARVARTKFRDAVHEQLKLSVHRQRILHDESVVVKALARHENGAGGLRILLRECRECQQSDYDSDCETSSDHDLLLSVASSDQREPWLQSGRGVPNGTPQVPREA